MSVGIARGTLVIVSHCCRPDGHLIVFKGDIFRRALPRPLFWGRGGTGNDWNTLHESYINLLQNIGYH